MTQPQLDLTIGVATLNRDQVLLDTLQDILSKIDPARMEVIVADQTRIHETGVEARLAAWDREGAIRRLVLSTASLTGARNRVLQAARAAIILFVDDDVRVSPRLFDEHVAAYADPHVAAAAGQVYNCRDPAAPPPLADPARGADAHFRGDVPRYTQSLIGCNHSVRRSAALAVGGYDEHFIASAHCEDFDMGDRLVLAGYKLFYTPRAWLVHLRAPSGGCRVLDVTPRPEWTNTANLFLYAFRHGRRRKNFLYYVRRALRTGPLRREVFTRPWRWPWAWRHLARGARYGYVHRHHLKSPWRSGLSRAE